jgi:predicted phage terminase large subunit-like protein
MSAGNVEFPESAPWLAPLLAEVMRFSGRGAEQDDQVDAMTQALTYLYGSQQTRWAEAMERYRRQRVA